MVWQGTERVFWKPNGVRQSNTHRLVWRNERRSLKNGVTQSTRTRLHDKADRYGIKSATAVVLQNVRFARCNHEAKLISAGSDHSIYEVLADRAGTLDGTIDSPSNRKQFL